MKSLPNVVLSRCAELLQVVGPDVVVGDEQPIFADEASRTAGIEADGGFLQVLEPGIRGLELVVLFEDLPWGVVEEPHALVRKRDERGTE